MISLAIDTTMGFSQIALKKQGKIYNNRSEISNNQAEEIAVLLEEALQINSCKYHEINEIYCLIGPGSFTGIRVAIAFVKGLSLGKNITIKPVANFYLFVSNFLQHISKYKNTTILIDCGKNKTEFYMTQISAQYDCLIAPKIISYDDALKINLTNNLIIGNFEKNFFGTTNNQKIISANYNALNIEDIFRLQKLNFNSKLSPLYLRKTYAENK